MKTVKNVCRCWIPAIGIGTQAWEKKLWLGEKYTEKDIAEAFMVSMDTGFIFF